MRIRLAHSPDPDDAFMFYGLASGAVPRAAGAGGTYEFEHVLADIQTLNEAALRGEYEVTAISIHAYPYVRARYVLTACGGSVGDGYGPLVVCRAPDSRENAPGENKAPALSSPMTPIDLAGATIAVPGRMTTAMLVLQLLLGRDGFTPRVMMFDRIPDAVANGEVEAGLLIHEGQLTYGQHGLHKVIDLGAWWGKRTGLPLPLGGNAVRRDLGATVCAEIAAIIRASIEYGLDHRAAAVQYALRFGRGLDMDLADRFVGMYVNEWTRDYGPRGREAIGRLLGEAAAAGLVPDAGRIDCV